MASRELVYRITLSTSDAKRQAANIRSTFENELRSIKVGNLDISSAVSQAHQLRVEFEQAAQAARQAGNAASSVSAPAAPTPAALTPAVPPAVSGGLNAGALLAGALITMQSVKAVANYAMESAKLDTQIRRTEAAFEFLAGGAQQAESRLIAIQRASNGTIDRMGAMETANQIAALGLAKTSKEFEDIARAAKIVSTYSSQIKSVDDALAQLGLFSGSESFARADQLLINVAELKDRMRELKYEDSTLTDQQAKLRASVELLNQSFGPMLDTTAAQASGVEKLSVAWSEFINQKSAISSTFDAIIGGMASMVDEMSVVAGFGSGRAILEVTKSNAEAAKSAASAWFAPAGAENNAKAFEYTAKLLEKLTKGVEDGVPTALEYKQQVEGIAVAADRFGVVTDDQLRRLMAIDSAYKSAVVSAKNYNDAVGNPDQARQNKILGQQPAIEKALSSRATKASGTAGVEASIALYRQQKAAVDAAIQQLIDSGVSDDNELSIRVAGIIDQLTKPFDELEARAAQVFNLDTSAFDRIGGALSSLNAGFTDFLPGVASARDELINLSTQLQTTGELSTEQAARLDELASIAYSVADGSSQLSGVINELGSDFLESNAYAAELVNQLVLTEAAFRNGQISAGTYAGMTASLTGTLLTLAQGAGVATSAIYALNAAQADMSNLPGFAGGMAVGGSISSRISSQQQASGRDQNRREMDRYNRDMARAQERSASRAGKMLEDGAKKASQDLKSALDKVPGLFSASQVTEKDMKDTKLGIYMNKADEKLRRLKDELINGVDWADVSLEDAKAALEKIGVQAANTKEGVYQQFEDMWNSQALWADMSNIANWIDKGAVEQQITLQKKSEEGRNNIYKFFGVQIDDAVSSATGGGGGAAIKVEPPKLVDIDPLTEGLQTGLDEYVNANGQMVKEQVAQAKALIFDPANLFGTGGKTGTMGPMPNPNITVTADPTVQALAPYLTGQQSTPQPIQLTPTLPDNAGEQIAMTLGDQLSKQTAVFLSHGSNIGKTLVSGIAASVGVDAKGNAQLDIAGFIAGNLATQAQTFTDQGTGIASLIKQGIADGMSSGTSTTTTITPTIEPAFLITEVEKQNIISAVGAITPTVNVALAVSTEAGLLTGLVQSINTSLRTIQPDIKREGTTVAQMLGAGITTALGSSDTPIDVATPLSTALTTNVAANSAAFATPGIVIAQLIMAAILANIQGGQQQQAGGPQGAGGGGTLAGALATNIITQVATAAPQFRAAGAIPAQLIEAEFRAYQYTSMADNLQSQVTQAISSKAGEFITVGGYIGGWIQQGLNQSFNAEINLSFAVNAGSAWGTAFMKGALNAVGGGTLVQAISDKVIGDLADEMEK